MDYYRPTEIKEALARLRMPGAAPLAGGTQLLAERPRHVQAVVDLSELKLDYLQRTDDVWVAGAMTRLEALAQAAALDTPALGVLREAARLQSPRPLRDMATLGGCIAGGEGEVVTALLALDASVHLTGQDERWVALAELLEDPPAYLRAGQLILEVRWPVWPGGGSALARAARTPGDRAMVAAVVCLRRTGATVRDVRLAVHGLGPRPVLAPAAPEAPTDQQVSLAVAEAAGRQPVPDDFRAGSAYRKAVAQVLARRAFHAARTRAGVA